MAVHSGKFGVVNGQSTVRNWVINDVQEGKAFVSSNTKGGTGRRESIHDWTGSFSAYGGIPAALPGAALAFSGKTSADDDSQTGTGQVYTGTAIVDSVVITWNWASGDILSYVTNFSGNGELVESVATLSDATSPVTPAILLTKVEWETNTVGPVFTEWENLAQAVLTITAANQPYVNSSSVISGKAWRLRKAGIIDMTLAVTEQATLRASLPALGVSEVIKLYTDATLFYELTWMQVLDFSGINVDIETGAITSRTVNFGMDGFKAGVAGTIKLPDASTYWPV